MRMIGKKEIRKRYFSAALLRIKESKARIAAAENVVQLLLKHLPPELEKICRWNNDPGWYLSFDYWWMEEVTIHVFKLERDWIDEHIFAPMRETYGVEWNIYIPEDSPRIDYTTEITSYELLVKVIHSDIPHCVFVPKKEFIHESSREKVTYELDCMGGIN